MGPPAAAVLTTALAGLAVMLLTALGVVARLWLRVIRPFRRMERFAAGVASGDLDTPLEQERGGTFGAFTEAFDVMRSELARSREREAELAESRRTLVAQLSHDIRTPVASIAAVAELLEVDERDPARQARLHTIRSKSGQIDDLVADLFRANEDELAALPVTVADHTSAAVATLVSAADVHDRVDLATPPDCLVSVDARRLAQVLDNVLSNAAKYAGTAVRGTWTMEPDALRLRLADTGPGVPAAELGAILGRGVRGSTVGGRPGQGLGLFTAAWLMERMGGGLAVSNGEPGFVVDLDLPLS